MNIKLILSALVVVAFTTLGVTDALNQKHQLQIKDVQLHSKTEEIKKLQIKHQDIDVQLQTELQQKQINQDRVKQLEAEKLQADEKIKQLEARKAEKSRLASLVGASKVSAASSAPAPSGGCQAWKLAAGIPNTHATNTLIDKESGCKWWAKNPSSGACGIPQAYPCSKLPCPLTEAGAVCQLQWMKRYVESTYGSWENALAKWYSRCGSKQGCWY